MKYFFLMLICFCSLSCNWEEPTAFSEAALQDVFVDLDGNEVSFKTILEHYKG